MSGGIDSGPSTTRSRGSKSDNRRDYNYVRPSQEPTEKAQKPCSEQSGNEHGHGDTELHRTTSSELRNAVIQTILSSWKTVVIMVSLIFGGCCANVSVYPHFSMTVLTGEIGFYTRDYYQVSQVGIFDNGR